MITVVSSGSTCKLSQIGLFILSVSLPLIYAKPQTGILLWFSRIESSSHWFVICGEYLNGICHDAFGKDALDV